MAVGRKNASKHGVAVARVERAVARTTNSEAVHAGRVAQFGAEDAETLRRMDEVNAAVARMAIPANTKRAVLGGAAAWIRFCRDAGINPTTVDTASLTAFGTWLVTRGREVPAGAEPRGYSESTARNRVAMALKWMRDAEGLTLTASEVSAGTQGIKNAVRLAASEGSLERGRGQARHVTPEHVDAMARAVDKSRTAGARDVALILTAFAMACRSQELANLRIQDVDRRDPNTYIVRVVQGKTRASSREGRLDRFDGQPDVCPVRAMDAWLDTLARYGQADPKMPLFPGVNRAGQPTGKMTAVAVSSAFKRAGERAEIGFPVTGHSMRAGFATAALAAGVDLRSLAVIGGWEVTSSVVHRYDRRDIEDAMSRIRSKQQ